MIDMYSDVVIRVVNSRRGTRAREIYCAQADPLKASCPGPEHAAWRTLHDVWRCDDLCQLCDSGDKAGSQRDDGHAGPESGAPSREEAAEANLADNGGGWALRVVPQWEFRSEWENSVATTIT